MNQNPGDAEYQALLQTLEELTHLTTDSNPATVLLRAVGVYRNAIYQTRFGGCVRFISPNGTIRTLKLPIR